MPWFAWIAIVGILVWGVIAIISMTTGRALTSGADPDDVEELEKRIAELESGPAPAELEDHIPTKADENLAAEDRWRLQMLEARLEELEKQRRGESDGPGESGAA